jgi:hypothetical protein
MSRALLPWLAGLPPAGSVEIWPLGGAGQMTAANDGCKRRPERVRDDIRLQRPAGVSPGAASRVSTDFLYCRPFFYTNDHFSP